MHGTPEIGLPNWKAGLIGRLTGRLAGRFPLKDAGTQWTLSLVLFVRIAKSKLSHVSSGRRSEPYTHSCRLRLPPCFVRTKQNEPKATTWNEWHKTKQKNKMERKETNRWKFKRLHPFHLKEKTDKRTTERFHPYQSQLYVCANLEGVDHNFTLVGLNATYMSVSISHLCCPYQCYEK